jgi:hypothetical protein
MGIACATFSRSANEINGIRDPASAVQNQTPVRFQRVRHLS